MTGWKPGAASDMMPVESAMVVTMPIQQAVVRLVDLVRELGPGDQIVLTDGGRQLARIIPEAPPRGGRQPGACKGMLEVLERFKEDLP